MSRTGNSNSFAKLVLLSWTTKFHEALDEQTNSSWRL